MPDRPARRRKARARPQLNFFAPPLPFVVRSTEDDDGYTEIEITSPVPGDGAFATAAEQLLAWMQLNEVTLNIVDGDVVHQIENDQWNASSANVLSTLHGWSNERLQFFFSDGRNGNVPQWVAPLDCWLDTRVWKAAAAFVGEPPEPDPVMLIAAVRLSPTVIELTFNQAVHIDEESTTWDNLTSENTSDDSERLGSAATEQLVNKINVTLGDANAYEGSANRFMALDNIGIVGNYGGAGNAAIPWTTLPYSAA